MAYIYVLKDPRTGAIRYVGKAISLPRRLSVHLCLARKGCPFYSSRWIRTLLRDDLLPTMEVVEETDDPINREKYWIRFFLDAGHRLTNHTEGGDGGFIFPRPPISEETRAKMRASRLGYRHSEESKARMRKPKPPGMGERLSATRTGTKRESPSAETRAKLSVAMSGRPKSPEHAAKVGAAHRGRVKGPLSEETKAKIAAAQRGKPRPYVTERLLRNHPTGKLSRQQADEIRKARFEGGAKVRVLAEAYGVSCNAIYAILNNKNHIVEPRGS